MQVTRSEDKKSRLPMTKSGDKKNQVQMTRLVVGGVVVVVGVMRSREVRGHVYNVSWK